MEWQDEGVVLARRALGERDALVSLFTHAHGRHAGVVKGGAGRRQGPLIQPGNRLQARWQARLESHLGRFDLEPVRLYPAALLDRPKLLSAMASALAVLEAALPERDPHPDLYAGLLKLLASLDAGLAGWPESYVRFEVELLADLGFGLDLAACAVTGSADDLAYVSPKSGRAVSRAGAGTFAPRLLPLPPFLLNPHAQASPDEIAQGLRLAGHFLNRHIFEPAERLIPAQRARFAAMWASPDSSPDPSLEPAP